MCVVQIINIYKEKISCCEEFKGEFVSTNHIFRKGTSTKLRAYATARMKEISQGGESTPSVYPFAMDTSGFKPVVGQCTGDICEGLTERFELPSLTPFSFTTIQ